MMKRKKRQQPLFAGVCLCAMLLSLFGGVPAAAKETNAQVQAALDHAEETVTELKTDGIYMLGGLGAPSEAVQPEEEILSLPAYEAASAAQPPVYTSAGEAMTAALSRYETIVEFPTSADAAYTVSGTEVADLVNAYLNSHPEFFYISKISYVSLANGLVSRLIFTYRYDTDTITTMRAAYEAAIRQACSQVDPDNMQADQISVVIHDYLAGLCTYQNDAVVNAVTDMRYTAYGALVEHTAVCQGYALAYQDILQALGIPCTMVSSASMNHAWNLVEIEDMYYHVDVTWDDTDTQEGQAVHENVLLSRQGITATGHQGYTIGTSITESTTNTYDQAYWKNVYSRIYYVDGGLYYLYPANTAQTPSAIANRSVDVEYLFVRKPVAQGEKNATLLTLSYATVQAEVDGSEEAAATVDSRLTRLFRQYKSHVRLTHDADTWYMTTAYGIYSVSMQDAAAAPADPANGLVSSQNKVTCQQVFRVAEMSATDTVVCKPDGSVQAPVIDALAAEGEQLLYHVEGAQLATVPGLKLGQPAYEDIYVYEKQDMPLVLTLNQKYQLHPYMIPVDADARFGYLVSEEDSQYISVSETGIVEAKAYTHDKPVTITVKLADTAYETSLQVSVAYVPVYEENGLLISNQQVTLEPSQTKQLSVCVRPGNASVKNVTYQVHSTTPQGSEVVTVDETTGLVKACNPGTAVVRATLVEYVQDEAGELQKKTYRASCTFHVIIRPTAISLASSDLSMQTGQKQQLDVRLEPENVTDPTMTYTSSDSAVVSVSESGELTALESGTAVITVTTNAQNAAGKRLSAACRVTVTSPQPQPQPPATTEDESSRRVSGITFACQTLELGLTDEAVLQAYITPAGAANQELVWTCSDKAIVRLTEVAGKPQAKLQALARGKATIRATTKEGAFVASCEVTVTKRKMDKVTANTIAARTYTGKAQKPSVTLKYQGDKLKKNRDYTISYQKNKSIGTAKIVIRGKGIYTGTKTIAFRITPSVPVLRADRSGRTAQLSWDRVARADGYQIVYATNSKFTKGKHKRTLTAGKTVFAKLTKLPKKTVYVKMRSYTLVKGKRVYSSYSRTITMKYKK